MSQASVANRVSQFSSTPWFGIALRLIAPELIVFFIGFLGVGFILQNQDLRNDLKFRQVPLLPLRVEYSGNSLDLAKQHLYQTFSFWIDKPDNCEPGKFLSSFYEEQCRDLERVSELSQEVASLPFLLSGLVFVLGCVAVRMLYGRANRAIAAGSGAVIATVTQPAKAPQTIFGWFYGLVSIRVQPKGSGQLTVFQDRFDSIPRPGDSMVIFQIMTLTGGKVWVGRYYAPHVSIVHGVKKGLF